MQEKQIVHLDCTLRDGGYYNNWNFSHDLIESYLYAAKSAGIDVAEVGFRFFSNEGFKGACAYTTDEFLNTLYIPEGLIIGCMINAADIVIDGALDLQRLETLVPRSADNSPVDLIRIASHVYQFTATLEACKWLKEKGYIVGANVMQASEYNQEKMEELAAEASNYPIDVLYVADSLGNIRPDNMTEITKSLRTHWSGDIGIHAHDNLRLALANSVQAHADGVRWVDSTITGMGRGPGNLPTEEFILEAIAIKKKAANLLPLLKLVREVFNPLKAEYGWGTNPFYYMAGQHSIHPTYIQEILKDTQYDEEDILCVIDRLKDTNGAKFDFNILRAAKDFYTGPSGGVWSPAESLKDKTVLLLGSGPSAEKHKEAIETYIKRDHPIVLAPNTLKYISPDLINYRIACHPVRLLADVNKHLELPQPLITPLSALPENVQKFFDTKEVLDFGIEIQSDCFKFHGTSCVVPNSNVLAYALSVIYSGQAKEILLAGFDGYSRGSVRNEEMDRIFYLFEEAVDIPLHSVTPSVYKIPQKSIYAI